MPPVTDEAICVRVWDWSETSQTLSLFTRGRGMLRAIAKGSKREHARFSGGVELLTRGEVVANIRPAESGGGLTLLTGWDLQELFPGARRSLRAFQGAMAMADLVQHALLEGDPHPEVFDALLASLRLLDQSGRDLAAGASFAWTLIERTGHRPELDVNVSTGTRLPDQAVYAFDARRGGLLPSEEVPNESSGIWRIRRETVECLRNIGRGKLPGAEFPDAAVARALRLLLIYFREASGREVPAVRTLLGTLESLG